MLNILLHCYEDKPVPFNSLTQADGGMEFAGSKSVSSPTIYPFLTGPPEEGTV